MPAGYRIASGVDLDNVFDPYVQGAKPANTGYRTSDGVDLAGRYAPLVYGTQAAATGYRLSNGADVNTLWAAKGTATYSLPLHGPFNAYSSGAVSSAMTASAQVSIKADGTYAVQCLGNSTATTPASGTWLPSGQAASAYQVQLVATLVSQRTNGPATVTTTAGSYVACTADQTLKVEASTGQSGGLEVGGTYTVTIRLKKVATGLVTTTTVTFDVQSAGAA